MSSTLINVFDWWAVERRDEYAIVTATDKVSYGEFYNWTHAVADWLLTEGLEKGDRLTILANNCLEWLVVSQATMLAGGILAPINPKFTVSEVSYLVGERYQSRFIFHDTDRKALAEGVVEKIGVSRIQALDFVHTLRGKSGNHSVPRPDVDADSDVVIIPTSGSTGYPKGVVYTHRTLTAYASDTAVTFPFVPLSPAKVLIFGPFCTSAGYVVATQYLHYGATVFIESSFDPDRAIDLIQEHQISSIMGAPIFLEMMMASPKFADADLSSIRFCTVGGARVTRQLLDAWLKKNVLVRQLYGQTEAGGQATVSTDASALSDPDKCGRGSVFTQLAVKDEAGNFCAPNTPGEIVIRGPGMMDRYWRDPEKTAETLKDGWLHTGDLGMADEAGLITFMDRLKDIIISGGLNISAMELERVISEVDGVVEVAVLAAHDNKFGETPLAIVYGNGVSVEAIVNHCNEHLSAYKVPRYVVLEDAPLPRLATGKIAKPELRTKYANAHETLVKVR
ncbi:class I adenylate-forming enzyme family protein [Zhongshania sp.]|uniref:class I adenylate-forming enzyme family protein n=1 Tax=Zhongshania sp. TaxID=1971902 RepID=UPI001B4F336F|nr:AMP-binding protein [Zhongshania sp.]MBQ0794878.1 AMP-binding protein [Zhongshania sp.]